MWIAAVALVLVALWVVPRLLAPEGADDATGAVVGAAGGKAATPALPAGSERPPEELLDEAARAADAGAGHAVGAAERLAALGYEARSIPGRVITADGSPLPPDLTVYASVTVPDPRELQMGGAGGTGGQDGFREFELPPAFEAADLDRRPGAELMREGTRVEVGADGGFELAGVPVDGAYVGVSHEGWYAHPPVSVLPGTDAVELTIVRGARIEGRVLDAAGDALAGARVQVTSRFNPYDFLSQGMRIVEVEPRETDERGRFVISPVPPGSGLSVRAWRDDRAPESAEAPVLEPGGVWRVDFTLRAGARLAGHVLDLDDAPVSNVTLQLQPASIEISNISMDKATWETKATSDHTGAFAFDGLGAGEYVVRIASKRYRPAASGTLALEPGDVVDDIVMRADPGLAVKGVVLDVDGQPLAGARVRANRPPSFMDPTVVMEQGLRQPDWSDAEGRFELSGFDDEQLHVSASLQGHVSGRVTTTAGRNDVVITLRPTMSVSGLVLSMVDGEPVESFSLGLTPEGGMFDMADMANMEQRFERLVRPRRFHGETGEFVLEDVVPGSYVLGVSATGYGNTEVDDIEVLADGPTLGVIVVLPPECAVTGVVLDSVTGEPLADVTATTGDPGLMSMISSAIGGGGHSTRTGPDGRFRLGGLGTGGFKLTLRHDSHADLSLGELQLGYAEVRDLGVLRMSPGAVVHGRVYDARGQGAANVPVMVAEALGKAMRNTRTDGAGDYRVQGLPPGTYSVMRLDFAFDMSGDTSDFMQDMVLENVQLATDEVRRVDLLTARGGATVEGRVRARDGSGAPAMLVLMSESGAAPRFAYSDDAGRYAIKNVGEGRYQISAIPMDGPPMGAGNQPTSSTVERLRVIGDVTVTRDFVLPGGSLRVALMDADGGRRLAGVRVILERTDPARPDVPLMELSGWRVGETYSDPQGEAEFRHLPEGTYTVVAGGQNLIGMGDPGWATVRHPGVRVVEDAEAFSLRLELQAAGALAGRVLDPAGRPVPDAAIWARGPDGQWLSTLAELHSDGAGAFTLGSLGEGRWTLAVRDAGHALLIEEGLEVRAGETRPVELRLRRGVQVLVDPGDFDPLGLDWTLLGPDGRVPTELSTLASVVHPLSADGRHDLGRFPPGEYSFTGVLGSQVVHDATLELSLSRDPEVVVLAEP